MRFFYFLFLLIIVSGCQNKGEYRSGFEKPENLEETKIIPVDSSKVTRIEIDIPVDQIKSSEIIGDFKYIPLETTPDALIGYYVNIILYKEHIYIYDEFSAEAVLIYDMNGHFLKKIGSKGGGPQEFYLLRGMAIDRKNDQLVLYDNKKRKMMYYTLLGEFLKSENIPYHFSGQFEFLSSGAMVAASKMNDGNFHLEEFQDYRLIYSDSLGKIQHFGFKYDDNIDLFIGWTQIIYSNNDLLYYPQYLNSIYSVSDTVIQQKYQIGCSIFSPFDADKIKTFRKMEEFDNYWNATASLGTFFSENNDYFYFTVHNKNEEYYYFYNKNTKKSIGFKTILFDQHFAWDTPCLYEYNGYFVGTVSVSLLKRLKNYKDNMGEKLPDDVDNMIGKLQEDDNSVLVLFKLK